jgi:hypothetical protein
VGHNLVVLAIHNTLKLSLYKFVCFVYTHQLSANLKILDTNNGDRILDASAHLLRGLMNLSASVACCDSTVVPITSEYCVYGIFCEYLISREADCLYSALFFSWCIKM